MGWVYPKKRPIHLINLLASFNSISHEPPWDEVANVIHSWFDILCYARVLHMCTRRNGPLHTCPFISHQFKWECNCVLINATLPTMEKAPVEPRWIGNLGWPGVDTIEPSIAFSDRLFRFGSFVRFMCQLALFWTSLVDLIDFAVTKMLTFQRTQDPLHRQPARLWNWYTMKFHNRRESVMSSTINVGEVAAWRRQVHQRQFGMLATWI